MATSTPHHPTTEPDSVDRPEPSRATHNVPVLVWIIVALLVAWFAYAAIQRGGHDRTPQGATAPQPKAETGYMPAAPANGGAPATPGGVISSGPSH